MFRKKQARATVQFKQNLELILALFRCTNKSPLTVVNDSLRGNILTLSVEHTHIIASNTLGNIKT